jgi:hypothetical protein
MRFLIVLFIIFLVRLTSFPSLNGQILVVQDTLKPAVRSSGWANEAVTVGYVTAPSVLLFMFVSGLVNEWNAGYLGIPASAMIIASAPLIYLGGRSADLPSEMFHSRAKLGWTLYALSIIPTAFALYGFTTDWGATVPLIMISGLLGSASIIAMTSYAFARADAVYRMQNPPSSSWNLGIAPLKGGLMASVTYRF